jgi:hypothetical protein
MEGLPTVAFIPNERLKPVIETYSGIQTHGIVKTHRGGNIVYNNHDNIVSYNLITNKDY